MEGLGGGTTRGDEAQKVHLMQNRMQRPETALVCNKGSWKLLCGCPGHCSRWLITCLLRHGGVDELCEFWHGEGVEPRRVP